jgi:predicted peroxiredoxin
MKLGILVNTDRHPNHVIGLTKAALAKGYEVIIFAMDDGARLLVSPGFPELCPTPGVTMNYCGLSVKQLNLGSEEPFGELVSGSQYQNASMIHVADRVIVL